MTADEVVRIVSEVVGVSEGAMKSRRLADGLPRYRALAALILTDHLHCCYEASAAALCRAHGSAISHELKTARRLMVEDDRFRSLYAQAMARIQGKVAA